MKIYHSSHEVDVYTRFKRRIGKGFLARLIGINIDVNPPRDIYVEPVYLPLITIDNSGGQFIMEVHWGWRAEATVIILMKMFPYIWIRNTKNLSLEYKDD